VGGINPILLRHCFSCMKNFPHGLRQCDSLKDVSRLIDSNEPFIHEH